MEATVPRGRVKRFLLVADISEDTSRDPRIGALTARWRLFGGPLGKRLHLSSTFHNAFVPLAHKRVQETQRHNPFAARKISGRVCPGRSKEDAVAAVDFGPETGQLVKDPRLSTAGKLPSRRTCSHSLSRRSAGQCGSLGDIALQEMILNCGRSQDATVRESGLVHPDGREGEGQALSAIGNAFHEGQLTPLLTLFACPLRLRGTPRESLRNCRLHSRATRGTLSKSGRCNGRCDLPLTSTSFLSIPRQDRGKALKHSPLSCMTTVQLRFGACAPIQRRAAWSRLVQLTPCHLRVRSSRNSPRTW